MDLGVEILNQAERIETLYAKAEEPGARRDLPSTPLDTCTMKGGENTPLAPGAGGDRQDGRREDSCRPGSRPGPVVNAQAALSHGGHRGRLSNRRSEFKIAEIGRLASCDWGRWGDDFITALNSKSGSLTG